MKFLVTILPTLLLFLLGACREEKKEAAAPPNRVRFSPAKDESWFYQVEVQLDPSAQLPEGLVTKGSEGSRYAYRKERRYLGEVPLSAENEEMVHCFEVLEEGVPKEREFSLINEQGIFARAWQKAGGERMIIEPTILFPALKTPGEVWPLSVPDPNDPSGPPIFFRQFQYFGTEELLVLGQKSQAHRVKESGKTGPLHLQRDLWFVNQLGIVKERKAYYWIVKNERSENPGKRIALIEETLIEHQVPKKELPKN